MESVFFQTLQNVICDISDALIYIPQGFLFGAVLVAVLLLWRSKYKKEYPSAHKIAAVFLSGVYAVVYVYLTFLSREPGSRTGRDWQLFATWGISYLPDAYFIENILLFIPFGTLLPVMVQKVQKLRYCVIAGALVSVVTEGIQLIMQRGHCQTDDVVTNVLGTVIGWIVWRGFVNVKMLNAVER